MFSRTKQDYKNVPSFRGLHMSQQRRTERARLREEVKGLSQRERDEVKCEERRVNMCLRCSVLAEFVFVSIGFCLFSKISIGFFLLKIRIGFLERKIVFLILFFKYCANVKNCGSFRCFCYIYIYIDQHNPPLNMAHEHYYKWLPKTSFLCPKL